MTSLPTLTGQPTPPVAAAVASVPNPAGVCPGVGDQQFLLRAFRSFSEAAGSLERSYGLLRIEVERLRSELEDRNAELARSLQENRSMRLHLDRILESLPCGVLVVSHHGEILRVNVETLHLFGMQRTASEVRVESLSELPEPVRKLLKYARTKGGEQELQVPGENSPRRWLTARHAFVADGVFSASVFILRDVSERKRLEEAREKLRREQALAEMSAVLAHEVRNPLGSLELFAGLLAEAGLVGECQKWVEHIQAGLRTLAATVNNVLHFHSLPEPDCTPVDLGRLLDWAQDFFVPLARQAHVELRVQNHVAGVLLTADRHRLEQVLLNLVLNAVRAMPGGGWIELKGRLAHDGKAVSLAVADAGPGIAPEDMENIFEPGFSRRAGSPGLGLAVCRKIVEQHAGTISATSRQGCGATFTLTFPLGRGPAEGVAV
jgi:two-component system sensor histidine kinase FlrB